MDVSTGIFLMMGIGLLMFISRWVLGYLDGDHTKGDIYFNEQVAESIVCAQDHLIRGATDHFVHGRPVKPDGDMMKYIMKSYPKLIVKYPNLPWTEY